MSPDTGRWWCADRSTCHLRFCGGCARRLPGVPGCVLVAWLGRVGEDLPVSRASFDVDALAAVVTELRTSAETVRTAMLGLRCPGLSLFAVTEQLWVFSARVESLVRNLLADSRHRAQLMTLERPRPGSASTDGAEMLVALYLPVIASYIPAPGHPLHTRVDELRLAADMISSTAARLAAAAVVDGAGVPLFNIGQLTDLVGDLHRDITTLSQCDPGETVAHPAGWDNNL